MAIDLAVTELHSSLPGDMNGALAEAVQAPNRFCTSCGGALDLGSSVCAACASRAQSEAETGADEGYRADLRTVKSSLTLYFALLGVSLVLIVWGMAADNEPSPATELFSTAAFASIVVGWAVRSRTLVTGLLKARFHAGWVLFAMIAALPTFLIASGMVHLLTRFGVEKLEYSSVFEAHGYGIGWLVASICLEPAIFEEIAFRGIIQGSLQRVLGPAEALIVSALMFGILHLSIVSLPHLLVLGFLLGWLRLRTQSLLPGMALHFCHNFLVILEEQSGSIVPW
jgi:membrane protease YdiL (CAAX protease family)